MVANSTVSPMNERPSTKRTRRIIMPADVVQILQSTIAYLNDCGLSVTGHNDGSALLLKVDGVNYENGKIVLA